jgi:hypothetical protein
MERFQVVSRAPFINLETGCLTAHGLKTMIALIQASGGDASGIIPLPSDQALVDLLVEFNHLTSIAVEASARASQGIQANKRIDALFDPSSLISMVGSLKPEIIALKAEVETLRNADQRTGGLLAEIRKMKSKLEEVEALCLQSLAVR